MTTSGFDGWSKRWQDWALELLATLADERRWLTAGELARIHGCSESAARTVLVDFLKRRAVDYAEETRGIVGAWVETTREGRRTLYRATTLGAARVAPENNGQGDLDDVVDAEIARAERRAAEQDDCPF